MCQILIWKKYEWVDIKPNVYYLAVDRASKKVGKVNINEIYLDSIKEIFERRNMKFDNVIMNPPYDGNLHLKIVNNILNFLSPNGKIINLSPIRWLQDPFVKYKSNTDYEKFRNIRAHIKSLDIISASTSQSMFNIICNFDLGVYTIDTGTHEPLDMFGTIIPRVADFIQKNNPDIDVDKKDGYRVRIPLIVAGRSGGKGVKSVKDISLGKLYVFYNGMKNGDYWYNFYQRNQFTKTTDTITTSILFQSEKFGNNFIESLNTLFGRYIMNAILINTGVHNILWMGNSINPRTGLKGYESDWTDNDFYQFFNITKDEQKVIEETMKPYLE